MALIAALSLDLNGEAGKKFVDFFYFLPEEKLLKAIITLPTFSLRTGNILMMS